MTFPNIFEALASLISVTRTEPKAACRPCIDQAHPLQLRRVYWAFTTTQRCAFCGKDFAADEVVGFEDA